MKNSFLTALFLLLNLSLMNAQDLYPGEVPSVILNNFQRSFPKTSDIEWEKDGNFYKVEFETGLFGNDHKAWYSSNGKLVRHHEEISESDLPQKVKLSIKNYFKDFRTDDIKKMSEPGKTFYKVELKKYSEEWKVIFDQNGKILQKKAD